MSSDRYGYDFEPSGVERILSKKSKYYLGPDAYTYTGKSMGDAYFGEELSSQFKNERTGSLFWFNDDVIRHMREVPNK
jgi:hypothetical protein